MKRCKKCGKISQDSDIFCGECGTNLEKGFTYICNHCGRLYDSGATVCPKCHALPDSQLSKDTKTKEINDTAVKKADELKEKASAVAAVATGAASSALKSVAEKVASGSLIHNQSVDSNKKNLIALLAAVIVVCGLGGYFLFAHSSDSKDIAIQSNIEQSNQANATDLDPKDKPVKKSSPPTVIKQDTPKDAFISFHTAITNKQLAEAYNILSPDYQRFMQSYDKFARGYDTTLRSDILELNSVHEDKTSAVFTYKLKADDYVDGGKTTQYFIGKVKLIKINNQWRIDSTEARKASQNSKAPVNLATIIAKGEVNLRAYPTTNANSVGVVREGDWVELLETGICKDSTAAIVISDEVYFGKGSKRIQLSKGMPIKIVSEKGKKIVCRVNVNNRTENVTFSPKHLVKLHNTTWYKISSNGSAGWIYSKYARKQ